MPTKTSIDHSDSRANGRRCIDARLKPANAGRKRNCEAGHGEEELRQRLDKDIARKAKKTHLNYSQGYWLREAAIVSWSHIF
jgi:hypothetical protein